MPIFFLSKIFIFHFFFTYRANLQTSGYKDEDNFKQLPDIITNNSVDMTNLEELITPHWTLKFQGLPSERALNNTRINVTAASGANAFLPCKIGHLGDRQVSLCIRSMLIVNNN